MQRINISEKDLTTSTVEFSLQDRVFIPGFAVNEESIPYIGIAVECDTLSDFYAIFRGAKDKTYEQYFYPVFKENQQYPVYVAPEGSTVAVPGFEKNAIPEATDSSSDDAGVMYYQNQIDPSWLYAEKLLSAGMPIVYVRMNTNTKFKFMNGTTPVESKCGYRYVENTDPTTKSTVPWKREFAEADGDYKAYDVTVKNAYSYLNSDIFTLDKTDEAPTYKSPIISPSDVDIKFITSGGYPTFEYHNGTSANGIMNSMLKIAQQRGDCVAIIDHTNNSGRALLGSTSVFNSLQSAMTTDWLTLLPFGTMFTPWCAGSIGCDIAPSITYLSALTAANIYNKNWLAVAGVSRGQVSIGTQLTSRALTNTIAEYYQRQNTDGDTSISINPITYIKSAGYCIWGNRTLTKASGTTTQGYATQFLNIRNLVSDVKKQARIAAQNCLFEQNNDILWVNFKEGITPLLDRMVTGTVLKGYKIIKGETSDKQKIVADIRIYPIYSVESFDITLTITDEDEVTTAE